MGDVPFTTEHLLAGLRHEADLVETSPVPKVQVN